MSLPEYSYVEATRSGKIEHWFDIYSKCHRKLPLPGILSFPANCHAHSVLLVSVEGIDGFAEGSVKFTIGKTHRPAESRHGYLHSARRGQAL
jgi:hypothetical protein